MEDVTMAWKQEQDRVQSALGLNTAPVAVFLDKEQARRPEFAGWRSLTKHRYCQALMRARNGERVVLEPDELSCPAAARAFGFRPLPDGLESGSGLVGFGIVGEPETGAGMFAQMPRLQQGELTRLALCPLADAPERPDVVVVEAPVEQLMWLVLADLRIQGGARRHGNTAVLQATCVDATIVPHTEDRLNFSYGCYGCREATDIAEAEAVLGFPGRMLEAMLLNLEDLAKKAIPNSRAKKVFQRLEEGGENALCE